MAGVHTETVSWTSAGPEVRRHSVSRDSVPSLWRVGRWQASPVAEDPAHDVAEQPRQAPTRALLCLARRRFGVLFAMLRDDPFYDPRPAAAGD